MNRLVPADHSILSRSGSVSSSLLQRVQAREPEAWRRLVYLYGPLVYSWCRQSQIQPSDAADIAQETFQAVLDAVGKFHRNHPEDTFSGWLWTITRSKICDHFRRRRAEALVQGGTDAQQRMLQVPDIEPESLTDETRHFREGGFMRRRLELVRAEFEDRTWKAFWRSAVDGQRAADVAEELHMTPAGVYKAKSRVIRRLREELDGLLDE